MQTYMGLVRNPADATLIFEACRQGKLPRIQRRLSDRERNAIRSGSIFVWDEKEAGMRRWTDGKSWSASRVAGSFLTYREMEGKRAVSDLPHQPKGPGQSGDDSDENNEGQKYEMTESYKYKVDGLIKQSFSITTSEDQKLHLISYYGRSHPNNVHLRPPTQDPALLHIQIPRGLYPESTLELSSPPGHSGPRIPDNRYPGPHSNVSGQIAPPSQVYPGSQQQQQQPQLSSSYPPSHNVKHPYAETSAWDPRNGPVSRPREIRPAIYDTQQREPLPDQQPSAPAPHPYHAQTHPQQQRSHHSSSHHPSQSHGHTPLFHPYAHPSSQPPEKSHAHEPYSPAHYRPSHSAAHTYGPQQALPPPPMQAEQTTRNPVPVHGVPEQSMPAGIHGHDSFSRRQSLPRMHGSPRRKSITAAPSFGGPLTPAASSKVPPYEAAANAAGQDISLPDLHSHAFSDGSDRPVARDIPFDRLGRWQEETRVLDVLRGALKL